MNINGAFRFHNVGQGLFYSGILSKQDKGSHSTFSFVYDCGTDSSASFLKREIDDFKVLLPTIGITKNKKLNLLVISHLHDDHVNGLEYLLQDVEVDTVVLPYINDGLKLLARLESHSDDEFLQVFYTDPIAWFLSKGVHRILLIGSEEITEEPDDRSFNQHRYIETPDIYVNAQSILKLDYFDKTEIAYLKNTSQVSYTNYYWEFHFENLKLGLSNVNSYIQIVENFKQKRCLTLEQIFKSKLLIDDLRRQIKVAFPNGSALNRTSVVMLHRPTESNMTILRNLFPYHHPYLFSKRYDHTSQSTILTGDLVLKNNEHLDMLTQLDKHHNYCLLVQYPHHGSKNNNIQYFIDLRAIINILSYGIINRYGHPHGKVLQQLPNIVFVNERDSFNYQIVIKDFEDS